MEQDKFLLSTLLILTQECINEMWKYCQPLSQNFILYTCQTVELSKTHWLCQGLDMRLVNICIHVSMACGHPGKTALYILLFFEMFIQIGGRQAGKLTKVKNVGNSKQKDLVGERPPPEGETSGHFVRANGELWVWCGLLDRMYGVPGCGGG